jgi:hypothetical protein
VANTFSYHAIGTLRMLPAMARAIERTRCKDVRHNPRSRRIKPGFTLGRLTVALRPDRAAGLAGEAKLLPFAESVDTGDRVTVEPAAGATAGANGFLTVPITGGMPVPLACTTGEDCGASGGTVGLGGGFDLVFQGRRTSVAGLAVAISGTAPDDLAYAVTGTLDGQPVSVAAGRGIEAGLGWTDEFRQRAGAALGTELDGDLAVKLLFSSTGPP